MKFVFQVKVVETKEDLLCLPAEEVSALSDALFDQGQADGKDYEAALPFLFDAPQDCWTALGLDTWPAVLPMYSIAEAKAQCLSVAALLRRYGVAWEKNGVWKRASWFSTEELAERFSALVARIASLPESSRLSSWIEEA